MKMVDTKTAAPPFSHTVFLARSLEQSTKHVDFHRQMILNAQADLLEACLGV